MLPSAPGDHLCLAIATPSSSLLCDPMSRFLQLFLDGISFKKYQAAFSQDKQGLKEPEGQAQGCRAGVGSAALLRWRRARAPGPIFPRPGDSVGVLQVGAGPPSHSGPPTPTQVLKASSGYSTLYTRALVVSALLILPSGERNEVSDSWSPSLPARC